MRISIQEFAGDIEERLRYVIKYQRRFPDEISVRITLRNGFGANNSKWIGNKRLKDVVANEPGKAEIEQLIREYIEVNELEPEEIEAVEITAFKMYTVDTKAVFPGKPHRLSSLAREEIHRYLQNRLDLKDGRYSGMEEELLPAFCPLLTNVQVPELSDAEFENSMAFIIKLDGWLSRQNSVVDSLEIDQRIRWEQEKLEPHVDPKTGKDMAEQLFHKFIFLYFKRKNNAATSLLRAGGIFDPSSN